MQSIIKDIKLAPLGHQRIAWAKEYMPLLNHLNDEYSKTKPFQGINMVVTIHLEAKTAYLALVLKNAGANVVVTGSNPLSTQDEIAAALVDSGVTVFATHGCTNEEYDMYLREALKSEPQLIIDDGGDLVNMLHGERRDLIPNLMGGSEETTTGVHRLKALAAAGHLAFPMIAVNDAYCKYLFDNRYGTGQSSWDGIMRTTNMSVAGRTVVVAGYGWCGKGVAMRAKGLGANVIVTEVDPIKGIEAVFDGFRVMPMQEAAKHGDIFVTVTGCKDVITKPHMEVMKNGAVMCNAGHFDVEINKHHLEELSVVAPYEVRKNIMTYTMADGRKLNLLGEGRLVNLACGDGHPIEIMDLSFAMQFLAMKYLLDHKGAMENKLYDVTALGELLIDFTENGNSSQGNPTFEANPGGAPCNVLAMLNRLGKKTAFIGKVGEDFLGDFLKETLDKCGVSTEGLISDADYFTTLAFVKLADNGERNFAFARKPGADIRLKAEEVRKDIICQSRIFHVGSLSLTDELSRNAEFIALKAAKNNGIIISYDPNYRASLWDSQEEACKWMRSILEYADIVKVSEEEIELLTGYTDVRKAAESITEYGAKIVLITLGEKGSFVYLQDQQEAYVSGYSSKVVDTTGAGDSFMGGFFYKICESGKRIEEYSLQEMIECVRFGNAMASLCVEREGAIPAMPVMEEVIKRINS